MKAALTKIFMRFIADNPDVPVVQMDSVIGNKSGKVLLTMFFQNSNLLLAFLRDHNTARSVWMCSMTSMPCLDGKPIVDSFLSS